MHVGTPTLLTLNVPPSSWESATGTRPACSQASCYILATIAAMCCCLVQALVERYSGVRVEALTPEGTPVSFEARGWQARILQHECDHLQVRISG